MEDIRPIAEEKAKQNIASQQFSGSLPVSAFESERQRAKREFRKTAGAYTGENVRKIEAEIETEAETKPLRTAAYCRVSTDDIGQILSIELQKDEYSKKIRSNQKWRYVGTYVDDGFSGTNTDHRPAFRLMMKDALEGRIDQIITKSVSRFARNLLDCISWVRKLQEHDPPVAVIFEDVNINTLDKTSSLILFVLAMVAEEESHMKSEAMLLSLEWRFSRGRFLTPKLLGYDAVKTEDGKKLLVVNEDEAKIVRFMYYMLLNGASTTEIAQTLTELQLETGGRRPDGTVNTNWTAKAVVSIMRNERYCGDVLARKTWTPNYRDHKSKKNNGKKNKYFQPGHHEAIVTRAEWNAAQKILNSHRFSYRAGYLPMSVIRNGALCGFIPLNRSWNGFSAEDYFRTCSIAMGEMEGTLTADLGEEYLPEGGYKLSGLMDDHGIQRIARELTEAERRVKAQLEGITEDEEAEKKKVMTGFQVASGGLFSHVLEPYVRINTNSIYFSSSCASRLTEAVGSATGHEELYVELLLNPVKRIMAVRPATQKSPNALRWASKSGGPDYSASAVCRILYEVLNWDPDYSYKIPPTLRVCGNQVILFFDLDNYIAKNMKSDAGEEIISKPEIVRENVGGIFFAAEDALQEVPDTDIIEQRFQEARIRASRTFGEPVFDIDEEDRFPAITEASDIIAEPYALDGDHSVDEETVSGLLRELSLQSSQQSSQRKRTRRE